MLSARTAALSTIPSASAASLRMPSDGKIYVVKILPERNAVVVTRTRRCLQENASCPVCTGSPVKRPRFRSGAAQKRATASRSSPARSIRQGRQVSASFDERCAPSRRASSAVLYDGDTVLAASSQGRMPYADFIHGPLCRSDSAGSGGASRRLCPLCGRLPSGRNCRRNILSASCAR